MTRFLPVVVLLIISLLSYLSFSGEQPEPVATESAPDVREPVIDEDLKNYLQEFEQNFRTGLIEKRIPGAAVAIVKDGEVIMQKGFGLKENGESSQVDEHTVFRLGSVSKGFASVLTGVHVEQGVLDWNEPVNRYLAEFKLNDAQQTERVEVRHLLSHTTGLPRHAYTNLVEDGLSLERIIPRLEQVPLIAREGEQLSYQNAAFSAIEKVLEVQTNTDFRTLLHQDLFNPVGMQHASASFDSIRYSGNTALPHVYYNRRRGRVPIPISKKYYNAVSSGGINASASDMAQWLLLPTGYYPDVISLETLETIFTPVATLNNRRFSRYWDGVNRSYYGLGWRMLDNHGQKIVYHGGYVNGYRSEIAFAPDQDIGICILINTNSGYPLEVIPGFFNHFRDTTPE